MGGGKVPDELLAQLHPLEIRLIPHLKDGTITQLAHAAKMQEAEVTRACQWLANKGAVEMSPVSTVEIQLGKNGEKALKDGMPEARFVIAVKAGAKTREAILKSGISQEEYGASLGILKRMGVLDLGKDGTVALSKAKGEPGKESVDLLKRLPLQYDKLSKKEQEVLKELKARKEYVVLKERRDHAVTLTPMGKDLAKTDVKSIDFADRLTPEDLDSGAWKQKRYRAYDVAVPVPPAGTGRIHFVEEAIEAIRKIWVEMGFTEMTGEMVQTAFWDLDALFVPQDHPARETHDTFYLENPRYGTFERAPFEKVKDAHETGGSTGSKGWQMRFSKEESEQLMLRTHTTVLSAQTLWAIRQGKAQMPGKYFTVGKVFRNEKLDWKHLFEFYQVEGIVVDKNVTFSQLIGYLKIFFAKMGYPDVRVRPHHFPYTEPSVEVDVWHPKKQQWIELGGAGVFRPEVTKTLIGEEVPVLAWGIGMERIIVDFFGFTDLRDLYRNDVKTLQSIRRYQ